MLKCPNCYNDKIIKNGKLHGRQRYQCKRCGYSFTKDKKRNYSYQRKQTMIKHYLEGESLRFIEKSFCKRKGPTNVTISYWLTDLDKKIANLNTTDQKFIFDCQDQRNFKKLRDFLQGRSIRNLEKKERIQLSNFMYIIFKLIKYTPEAHNK